MKFYCFYKLCTCYSIYALDKMLDSLQKEFVLSSPNDGIGSGTTWKRNRCLLCV